MINIAQKRENNKCPTEPQIQIIVHRPLDPFTIALSLELSLVNFKVLRRALSNLGISHTTTSNTQMSP
jgi:hypothetical protein